MTMPRPRAASIRGRLIALTLAGILIPVFAVLAIVGENEIRDIRADMLASSTLMGSVVAEYGAGALAFEQRSAADTLLHALGRHEEFMDAELYDNEGRLFTSFARAGVKPPSERAPDAAHPESEASIEGDRIHVERPLDQGGARYGTLVLHTSVAPLTTRIHAYLWGLFWLTIGVIMASLMLAVALERMVSRRLLKLADVARNIAEHEDYDLRAVDEGSDEIGQLADAFNRMVAEVGRRQEQARQAVRVRDEFLSVASHELKTPLTSLKLQVQGMIEMPPTVADAAEAKRIASSFALTERQVRRLERLINNLLDVSRIAIGRFMLQVEEVDLAAMVRDVAAQFAAEIARAGATLTLDLPETAVGRWDPLRLEQVVVNLLSNAIKYGEGKPIDITVQVDALYARILVRDRGIGVARIDQDRIFERFERAVSVNYGGLGLGLFITREIVQAHAGTIRIDSTLGQGSTFLVEIPRHGPPQAHAKGAAA
jgi:signal transduction histidine kinase